MPEAIVAEQCSQETCETELADELSQEFLLVHVVLEGFATVDENDWNLIIELTTKIHVSVDVDLVPGEASSARQFGEAFLHHFAQVTSFARVNHDAADVWHAGRILARASAAFP